MFLKIPKIVMDSVEGDASPSGYGTESAASTETTETTQTQGDTSNSTQGDSSGAGASNETAKNDNKSEQKTEDLTGYDKPKDEKPKEEKPKEEKPLELDLKGLEEDKVKDIIDFAKSHGLTKEQAQALVDKRKGDEDQKIATVEAYKAEEAKIFARWEQELRDDPDFGGENFAQSIHNVNKLIREELPEIKNLLTKSGKRVPPNIMKEFNAVARKLYGETELVQGDRVNNKDTWKPTDFYKQKT